MQLEHFCLRAPGYHYIITVQSVKAYWVCPNVISLASIKLAETHPGMSLSVSFLYLIPTIHGHKYCSESLLCCVFFRGQVCLQTSVWIFHQDKVIGCSSAKDRIFGGHNYIIQTHDCTHVRHRNRNNISMLWGMPSHATEQKDWGLSWKGKERKPKLMAYRTKTAEHKA